MSIRIAKTEDIPSVLSIYAPYVTETTASFEYSVPSLEEFTQRFLNITRQFPWLVWEESGRILGYAYGSAPFERAAYQWCAEPSIYLAPEAQRRGIGRQLYGALESILKAQGYRLLYAIITSENRSSIDFHTAMGYRQLAQFPGCGYKQGRLLGVTWMEKQLNFVENPSEPPVSWKDIVNNDKIFLEVLDKMSLSPWCKV